MALEFTICSIVKQCWILGMWACSLFLSLFKKYNTIDIKWLWNAFTTSDLFIGSDSSSSSSSESDSDIEKEENLASVIFMQVRFWCKKKSVVFISRYTENIICFVSYLSADSLPQVFEICRKEKRSIVLLFPALPRPAQ